MPSQPIEACACNRRRSAVWKSKEKWTCTRLRSTNRVTIRWWIETIENLHNFATKNLIQSRHPNGHRGEPADQPRGGQSACIPQKCWNNHSKLFPLRVGARLAQLWCCGGRRPSWAPRFNGQLSKPAQRRRNWAPFRGLPPCRARSKLTSNAVAAVEKWRTFYTPQLVWGLPAVRLTLWRCSVLNMFSIITSSSWDLILMNVEIWIFMHWFIFRCLWDLLC